MAGILFIVNVPKKEYENNLKRISNLMFDAEKYENASKVIHELKEKHLETINIEPYVRDENVVVKCRSTDCLHRRMSKNLDKCTSDSTLSEGVADASKSYGKSSWEEIKQVIKQKKNKLKINRPMRGVDILGAFSCDTPLETILSEIVLRLGIKNASWNSTKGDRFWQVIFSLESGSLSEDLLQVLRTFGIGSRFHSSVSLLPCALYYKSNERIPEATEFTNADHESESSTAWSRFSSSVRARTNLAQVLHDVRAKGTLTFDWVFMLLVASFVAAIGLVENSTVVLVASMLISPLMGPITAGTLGTVVRDRSLQIMGVKNEFMGLFLSLVTGFLVGITICALDEQYRVIEDWPTDEMLSRCAHRSLWVGVLVAIPSGAGCALAVLGDHTASLVGVAISASLLPPAVNAGLLWAMSVTRLIVKSEEQRWLVERPSELALMGTASLCLTLVNIVCIFLTGIAVYKVKEVSPLDRRDISWWRANRERLNATNRRQSQDHTVNWESYTNWCTASMCINCSERKEKFKSTDKRAEEGDSVPNHNTTFYCKRPVSHQRQRSQNMEGYNHKIQREDTYIPLNSETSVDMDRQIEEITKTNAVQNLNEANLSNGVTPEADILSHQYYNLAFESDKEQSHLPTIDPSLSYTVNNKIYGGTNAKTFIV